MITFHDEAPQINVHLVKSGEAPGGIGEPGTSCVMPALTNAIYAACSQRETQSQAARRRTGAGGVGTLVFEPSHVAHLLEVDMFKRTKSASVACVFVLAAMAAPGAGAQSSDNTQFPDLFWREIMMKAMDTNKDGMVTREEFLSYMGQQYDKMDQNKDGKLTRAEFMDKKMMRTTFPTSVTGP